MRLLTIVIALCLISFACNNNKKNIETDTAINITKTETGYNIYSNKGILILEFTEQNSDSTSLKTLDYIYETAKYFYDENEPKEKKNTKSLKVKGI